ncbi:hypothetical protein [Pyxidicoccus trucidator]|uniref:hypothetical protein n=1 Tax=Pyxidicoccus trucidator TaxID=2709662 RepID=UPI0013DCFFAD|nr:hypothetical protein [Pyxidicoccus trucidator]
MSRNPLHRSLGFQAPRMLLLAGLVLATSAVAQVQVAPVSPIHNEDGKIVGFNTNEPSTYFLLPSAYLKAERQTPPAAYLSAAGLGPDGRPQYDLRVVFTPSYAHAAANVVGIRTEDPHALFFPLPMFIDQVRVFLPSALGSVAAQLTPDGGISTPFALYFRLRLTEAQVGIFRQLARGGLVLQGFVGTIYQVPDGYQYSSVPLTLLLPESTFTSTLPPVTVRPEQWMKDLLEQTELFVEGPLDGQYSLGGGIFVTFQNSVVQGKLRTGTFDVLSQGAGVLAAVATASPNLDGEVQVFIPELGLPIVMKYQAVFEAKLDLFMMEIELTRFDISAVQVNGTSSPFHTQLLANLIQQPDVRAELAAALSRELQERILAQTLFGVSLP